MIGQRINVTFLRVGKKLLPKHQRADQLLRCLFEIAPEVFHFRFSDLPYQRFLTQYRVVLKYLAADVDEHNRQIANHKDGAGKNRPD